jgi:hypothetical protein
MNEVAQARFVKVPRSDERQSNNIRFFGSNRILSMRANFTEAYDSNGNLVKDKAAQLDEL